MMPEFALFERESYEGYRPHFAGLLDQVNYLVHRGYNSQVQGNG
jgi:hypothetical protein